MFAVQGRGTGVILRKSDTFNSSCKIKNQLQHQYQQRQLNQQQRGQQPQQLPQVCQNTILFTPNQIQQIASSTILYPKFLLPPFITWYFDNHKYLWTQSINSCTAIKIMPHSSAVSFYTNPQIKSIRRFSFGNNMKIIRSNDNIKTMCKLSE